MWISSGPDPIILWLIALLILIIRKNGFVECFIYDLKVINV
jgi:hypothetical protein